MRSYWRTLYQACAGFECMRSYWWTLYQTCAGFECMRSYWGALYQACVWFECMRSYWWTLCQVRDGFECMHSLQRTLYQACAGFECMHSLQRTPYQARHPSPPSTNPSLPLQNISWKLLRSRTARRSKLAKRWPMTEKRTQSSRTRSRSPCRRKAWATLASLWRCSTAAWCEVTK